MYQKTKDISYEYIIPQYQFNLKNDDEYVDNKELVYTIKEINKDDNVYDIKYLERMQVIYNKSVNQFERNIRRANYKSAILLNFNIPNNKIYHELKEYSDYVYDLIEEKIQQNMHISPSLKNKYCRLLILIMANLYNSYIYRYWLMVNRNSKYYSNKTKIIEENRDIFKFRLVTKLLDILEQYDLLYVYKGSYNYLRLTRYYPYGEMRDIFQQIADNRGLNRNEPMDMIGFSGEKVLVRDENQPGKKKGKVINDIISHVKFPNDNTYNDKLLKIKNIKNRLDKINNYLFQSEIFITQLSQPSDWTHAFNLAAKRRFLLKHNNYNYLMLEDCKRFVRIFNDANIERGGRIYAPFQQFSSATRKNFLINNEPVELVDISSSHIRMFYHMLNIDFQGDAYDVFIDSNNYTADGTKIIRKINKKILQTIINAKIERAGIQSSFNTIKKELIKNGRKEVAKRFKKHLDAKNWMDKLIKKHEPIKYYFLSGYGIILQYIESEIIINTILRLIDMDIPALSIHDEIVVPYSKRDIAKSIIEEEYKKQSLFNNYDVIVEYKSNNK